MISDNDEAEEERMYGRGVQSNDGLYDIGCKEDIDGRLCQT